MTGYAMILNEQTGKCLLSNKKDLFGFVESYIDDAQSFYTKVKIIPANEKVMAEYKEFKKDDIKVNSSISEFTSINDLFHTISK